MSGGKKNPVDEWRQAHLDELDKTLAVLVALRDDETLLPKDRIDASKAVARMFGGLTPNRSGREKVVGARPAMDDKLRRELENYLDDI